jgi:hypothetical protein
MLEVFKSFLVSSPLLASKEGNQDVRVLWLGRMGGQFWSRGYRLMTSGYTGPWSPGSVCELRKDTLTTGIGDEADQGGVWICFFLILFLYLLCQLWSGARLVTTSVRVTLYSASAWRLRQLNRLIEPTKKKATLCTIHTSRLPCSLFYRVTYKTLTHMRVTLFNQVA